MSTPPSPIVPKATVLSHIETYIKFLKAHERILIFVGCLFLAVHVYDKGIDYLDRHATAQPKADAVVVQQDVVTGQQLATQLAQLRSQVAADAVKSRAAIKAAQASAAQHQAADQTLPMPDLALRWEFLVNLTPADITPQPDNKLLLTEAGSRATVNQLENIPALTTTIVETQKQLIGCQQESSQKDKVIANDVKTLADTNKKATDDAKTAKDNQRKSFWKGTKWGAGIATAAGILLKIALIVK